MLARNPEPAAACGAAPPLPRRHAFSLIELIAAVAIVTILAGMAFMLAPGMMGKAKKDRARSELQIIQQALEAYRGRFGDYPRVPTSLPEAFTSSNALLLNALNGRLNAVADPAIQIDLPPMLNNSALTFETNQLPLGATLVNNRILDPWGNPYFYDYKPKTAGAGAAYGYQLYSAGPDGKYDGGSGDDIVAQ